MRAATSFVTACHELPRPLRLRSEFFRGDSAQDNAEKFAQKFPFHGGGVAFEPECDFNKGVGPADDRVLIKGRHFLDPGKPPIIARSNDKPVDGRACCGAVFADVLCGRRPALVCPFPERSNVRFQQAGCCSRKANPANMAAPTAAVGAVTLRGWLRKAKVTPINSSGVAIYVYGTITV